VPQAELLLLLLLPPVLVPLVLVPLPPLLQSCGMVVVGEERWGTIVAMRKPGSCQKNS
jgi:hypothetical protein